MFTNKCFIKLRNFNKSLLTHSKKYFAINVNALKSVLRDEIQSEEKNYSPVDKSELNQFYQSTNFNFVENDSTKMELKKVENGTEITIKFFSKPPMPQMDQDPNNPEDMGKNFKKN